MRGHSRSGCGGRRLQHPVRHQPARRRDDRHRDEPARLAIVRSGWTTGVRSQDDRLPDERLEALRGALRQPTPERVFQVKRALERDMSVRELYELTAIDPWFLEQLRELVDAERWYTSLD